MKKRQKIPLQELTKPTFTLSYSTTVQRKCACGGNPGVDGECANCRAKRLSRQRQATIPAPSQTIPSIVHEVLGSPGYSLDVGTRAFMEPRFGHDFSNVRVHTDAKAAESARAVNALAYTVGRDIVFGTGQYAPKTSEGKRLMAHELTHTIQQGSGVRRLMTSLEMTNPADATEKEAQTTANVVMQRNVTTNITHKPIQVARQTPPATATPPVCPIVPLTPITDPDALAMEGGARVVWNHTQPGLQAAANALVALIRAEPGGIADIVSAFRPQAYQDHFHEIRQKAIALQHNTSPECATVKREVNREMAKHSLSINRPVANRSPHTSGRAVDIDWGPPHIHIDDLARRVGLHRPLPTDDPIHFVL